MRLLALNLDTEGDEILIPVDKIVSVRNRREGARGPSVGSTVTIAGFDRIVELAVTQTLDEVREAMLGGLHSAGELVPRESSDGENTPARAPRLPGA